MYVFYSEPSERRHAGKRPVDSLDNEIGRRVMRLDPGVGVWRRQAVEGTREPLGQLAGGI